MKELTWQCAAEAIGTFILVLFGVGVVHTAVATGAQVGLWQVAVVWGIGVTLAIYATAGVSGAHLNPAVTLAFAAWDRFPWRKVLPYWLAQVLGAYLAAALLHSLFEPAIRAFELVHGISRGAPGSELSAMMYGEYFPNPAIFGTTPGAWSRLSLAGAFGAECLGTSLLALVIFVVTDSKNGALPGSGWAPVFIGSAVSAIISVIAPLTQAGLNPARDFGPRLFAWGAGWGTIAIPGPRGGFFSVYVIAPMLGALLGAGLHRLVLRNALNQLKRRVS